MSEDNQKACVKRLEKAYGISYFEETAAKHQIQFAIHKDIATIYLDTSGVGLHKRGYRRNSNDAPIKETLAAGIVDLARVVRTQLWWILCAVQVHFLLSRHTRH